jgi:hypothetical protein
MTDWTLWSIQRKTPDTHREMHVVLVVVVVVVGVGGWWGGLCGLVAQRK